MANPIFEAAIERMFLHAKTARYVHERAECYRAFCGALELADLIERVLVYVMDKEADCRAQEEGRAANPAKGAHRWSVKWGGFGRKRRASRCHPDCFRDTRCDSRFLRKRR